MSTNLDAKRLAIAVPVIVGASAWVSSVADPNTAATGPGDAAVRLARIMAGAWILAILLSIAAEVVPALSKGFSLLILTTALLVFGGPIWAALAALTAAAPAAMPPSLVGTTEAPGATRLPATINASGHLTPVG